MHGADKVADMVADKEVDKVADMVADKVVDNEHGGGKGSVRRPRKTKSSRPERRPTRSRGPEVPSTSSKYIFSLTY